MLSLQWTVEWVWVWVGTGHFPHRLDHSRSPHAYVNQRLQTQLELLMMSGMPLETCWAFNERWINKFYYKVASCWLFLLSHITMHGSMNIKNHNYSLFNSTSPTHSLFLVTCFFLSFAYSPPFLPYFIHPHAIRPTLLFKCSNWALNTAAT